MPDLLPGSTIRGLDATPTPYDEDVTDIAGFTHIIFQAGSPNVGVVFVAPTTGRVRIDWHARAQPGSANHVQIGYALRTGSILGSGTLLQDGQNEKCLETPNVSGTAGRLQAAMYDIVSGLTPGADYNVLTCHRMVTAGSGTIFARSIGVTSCP